MTDLRTAWISAVQFLGGSGDAAVVSADELVVRYGETHRRYHTARHVIAVLDDAAWLADEVQLAPAERMIVALAACAHDVVYEAAAGDDERASAAWAVGALAAAGVGSGAVERVEALVLATLTHESAPEDLTAAVLLDADLAILAAEPAAYSDYAAAVRAEYAAVPDDGWRAGRAAVLRSLLSRSRLFGTEPGRRRWETVARRNVVAELDTLGP